jgi:CDGSH-type Zn-finger protein
MENKKNNKAKIVVSKNGPYLVSGNLPLKKEIIGCDKDGYSVEWKAGEKYPGKENCALCRCGQSKNKPYCDGSHIKTGFNGTETASRQKYLDQAEKIEGPEIDLTDLEDICAGARFCHNKEGNTWELTKNSDDPKAKREAIAQSGKCPSGRLVNFDKKTGQSIEPEFEPSIGIVDDPERGVSGPLWVKGGVEIESAAGEKYEKRNRVTLCRCGKSKNKPFCDASHLEG